MQAQQLLEASGLRGGAGAPAGGARPASALQRGDAVEGRGRMDRIERLQVLVRHLKHRRGRAGTLQPVQELDVSPAMVAGGRGCSPVLRDSQDRQPRLPWRQSPHCQDNRAAKPET